jgi:Flp pilus assembly protein TadG
MSNQAGKHMKRNLWKCQRGAVAPLVGVCVIMLVGAVGVAVDIGRGQVAQSKLQAALDSAGLAAGAIVGQNLTEENLKPEAEKYLNANFGGSTIDASISDFNLELSDDNSIVTLEAQATLPTTFMRIFGQQSMQVAARSEITRETTGLEVAVVLDVTGSMDDAVGGSPYDSTKKIAALRTAGVDLVNILFGSKETQDDLWVGVVPFSQSVNVGTSHTDWMSDLTDYTNEIYCVGPKSGTPACPNDSLTIADNVVSTRTNPITRVNRYMYSSSAGWYFTPHGWGGCVLERWDNNRDVTDDTPSTQKWQTYFAPDTDGGNNNWAKNSGNYAVNPDHDGDGTDEETSANKGCPEQAITTLSNKKSTALAAINALQYPRGNTHINVGAVWGWRLLSPSWRGLWGGDMDSNDLPLEYDEPLSQKAMILMTDGTNTMTSGIYTAYGWLDDGHLGTTDSSTAVSKLNAKTKTICTAMKAKGILIYTIVFGNDSSTSSKNLMKNCASQTDYYFFSPSQAALSTAFKTIGDSLSKLRVSR